MQSTEYQAEFKDGDGAFQTGAIEGTSLHRAAYSDVVKWPAVPLVSLEAASLGHPLLWLVMCYTWIRPTRTSTT